MKNEEHWLFRVNGMSFDEWITTRKPADSKSFEDTVALMEPSNGTRSESRPTNGRCAHTAPVNGTATKGATTLDTPATRSSVNGTTHRWESAADQPRVVCWREPPTEEQQKQTRLTGEIRFVPSCGPHWQGHQGRRPRLDQQPAERRVSDNRTSSRRGGHAGGR